MAVGWAGDGAVQEQIDASIDDAVKQARNRLPRGESLTHCTECGEAIPRLAGRQCQGSGCIECQRDLEEQETTFTVINRRGSKDSQLK